MTFLEALRHRRSRGSERGAQAETSSPDDQPMPIAGYDELGQKEISDQLSQLSQVQLATIETYERAHDARPVVLDKLRYMLTSEPVPGYDALTTEQIAEAIAEADAETVKAVRDYERKFQHRRTVLDEAARALPNSPPSAGEERARKDKATLLREGYADRARIAPDASE
jgi:hypothetical protein